MTLNGTRGYVGDLKSIAQDTWTAPPASLDDAVYAANERHQGAPREAPGDRVGAGTRRLRTPPRWARPCAAGPPSPCAGTLGDWCRRWHSAPPVPTRPAVRGAKPCAGGCNGVGSCNHDLGVCQCPAGAPGSGAGYHPKSPRSINARRTRTQVGRRAELRPGLSPLPRRLDGQRLQDALQASLHQPLPAALGRPSRGDAPRCPTPPHGRPAAVPHLTPALARRQQPQKLLRSPRALPPAPPARSRTWTSGPWTATSPRTGGRRPAAQVRSRSAPSVMLLPHPGASHATLTHEGSQAGTVLAAWCVASSQGGATRRWAPATAATTQRTAPCLRLLVPRPAPLRRAGAGLWRTAASPARCGGAAGLGASQVRPLATLPSQEGVVVACSGARAGRGWQQGGLGHEEVGGPGEEEVARDAAG